MVGWIVLNKRFELQKSISFSGQDYQVFPGKCREEGAFYVDSLWGKT
jgi:hypothetical protein